MKLDIVVNKGYTPGDVESMLWKPQRKSIIHVGRNVLWTVEYSGRIYMVKSFCCGLKNRLIYRFRRSKARRSFENARELLERGVSTPEPIAWIERRDLFGLLTGTWYVSRYDDEMCLCDAVINYGNECMMAFARFVTMLHTNGIRHDDLNNTNVRAKRFPDGSYSFDLIDLNRMKIYPAGKEVPVHECLRNICRFSALDSSFVSFVKAYMYYRGWSNDMFLKAIAVKRQHDRHGRVIQVVKKML